MLSRATTASFCAHRALAASILSAQISFHRKIIGVLALPSSLLLSVKRLKNETPLFVFKGTVTLGCKPNQVYIKFTQFRASSFCYFPSSSLSAAVWFLCMLLSKGGEPLILKFPMCTYLLFHTSRPSLLALNQKYRDFLKLIMV